MTDVPRKSAYPMIPMHEALSLIASTLQALPATQTAVASALHQTLSSPVHAPAPLPPFRASVKDGYAVVHTPTPPSEPLRVVGEVAAGTPPAALTVGRGEAAYVTTGARVPDGADAVVMVEHTRVVDKGQITVDKWPSAPGVDVRQIGSDVPQDALVLPAGTLLGAAEIGILAGCGIAEVETVTRPAVGVLSSGDELVDVADLPAVLRENGGKLPVGKIVDSNRPMLLAAIREALPFCEVVDVGIVKDDFGVVRKAMQDAVDRCHIVLTSGGVSMGNRDVIKPVLEELATVHFGRVVMKPGKPLTYATVPGKNRCFIGLPGNPVSAFVCFHLAVSVAAKTLAGWTHEEAMGSIVEVSLKQELKLDPQRPEFHRAVLEWENGKGYVATSTGNQTSSRLLSARSANALLALPSREGSLAAGTMVKAYLLSNASYSG